MPEPQSQVSKVLKTIQNLLSPKSCIKRKSRVKNKDERLFKIFNELSVGISEVFHDDLPNHHQIGCDKVSCKIKVLSEQIEQVRILQSMWKNGFQLDVEDLKVKCSSLSYLVDCIREDVFYSYLRLPAEKKAEIMKRNRHMSWIFAELGLLENTVTDLMKSMTPTVLNNNELTMLVKPLMNSWPATSRHFYTYHMPQSRNYEFTEEHPVMEKEKVDVGTDPMDEPSPVEDIWKYGEYERTRQSVDERAIIRSPATSRETLQSSINSLMKSVDRKNSSENDDILQLLSRYKFSGEDRISENSYLSERPNEVPSFSSESSQFVNRSKQTCGDGLWKVAAERLIQSPFN